MFRKLKWFYYSYAINELPSDLLLAIKTKQFKVFVTNGFNCTTTMLRGWKGREKFLESMKRN